MLQTLRESTGRWVAVAILGLIAVTFVFFGIDFSLTGPTFAAKVNGEDIPLFEFERELQAQQSQYQQLYRLELTEDLRRELRRNVIDGLVRRTALQQRVDAAGYRVSDQRLSDFIRSASAFQVGGEFSIDVYRAALANQGLSPAGFEAMQRRQLELSELQIGVAESTFLTPAEFRRYIELFNEERELAYALFAVDDFLAQVEISDAAVAEHYEANSSRYMSEESVDIEYVELSQADIAADIELSDEELRRLYDEEQERFQTQEERRVRHILFNIENGDSETALAEAEAVMARLDAGEDFATLAAELSDDAGTSNQGGDLGWIARGMLEGPFEDALYDMEVGEVRGPVESSFGVHVMRLDEIRAGDAEPFEAVRDELRSQYQSEQAENLFFDRANELADRTFDAYDELATVASETGLPLQTAMGFPRTGDSALFANSAAVVQAAFDPEVLNTGINSPLIELADDHVLVLRVTDHSLPAPLSLDAVSDEIRAELKRAAAEDLAADAIDAFAAEVEAGAETQENVEAHGGRWFDARWVERTDGEVPTELLATAFGASTLAEGAPQRELVPMASGDQAVLLLRGVRGGEPEEVPREERDQRQRALADQAASIELSAYIDTVSEQATVRIPEEVLNPQF